MANVGDAGTGGSIEALVARWRARVKSYEIPTGRASDVSVQISWCANELEQLAALLTRRDRQPENEHAGGSLNGPSRLGASPNTDTGGECVLVPRSLVSAALNLFGVTEVGLHGTPWAQSEMKALIQAFDEALTQRDQPDDDSDVRKALWLNHGCSIATLYGDDGEMQCNACHVDFKRDGLPHIARMLFALGRLHAGKLPEATQRDAPQEQDDLQAIINEQRDHLADWRQREDEAVAAYGWSAADFCFEEIIEDLKRRLVGMDADPAQGWQPIETAPQRDAPQDRYPWGEEMKQYAALGIGAESWVELEDIEQRGHKQRNNDLSGMSISWRTFKLVMTVLRAIRLKDFQVGRDAAPAQEPNQ